MSAEQDFSFQQKSLIQQGYQSYTADELQQLEWGLRFTPSVCSLLTLIGLVFQLPYLLLAVAVLGFVAFFLPASHPMDLLYNNVVRHTFGAVALPPNPLQRRLACLSAGIMNVIAALLFFAGAPVAAWIVGGMLLVLQAIVIATHFCTLSWMYEGVLRALGQWNVPIDLNQAKRLLDNGEAKLIDVRGPDEFARGHLPKAVNVPLEHLKDQKDSLRAESNLLLYCQSGMRSHIGAELLRKEGLSNAHNLGAMQRAEQQLFSA